MKNFQDFVTDAYVDATNTIKSAVQFMREEIKEKVKNSGVINLEGSPFRIVTKTGDDHTVELVSVRDGECKFVTDENRVIDITDLSNDTIHSLYILICKY